MKKLNENIKNVKQFIEESEQKALQGSFAYELQALSLANHLQELEQKELFQQISAKSEVLDFRLMAESMKTGAISLAMLSKISDCINRMLGHIADRIIRGQKAASRVPEAISNILNLQLCGLLPGSTRLLISANADRDLFEDGLAKNTILRIFNLLDTYGEGESFLESIMDFGAYGVRNLRNFLQIINSVSGSLELNWEHNGCAERSWKGTSSQITQLSSALDSMIIKEAIEETADGVIELLSKNERIHLRKENGELIKIYFSNTHLQDVEQLHLNQKVSLVCKSSETENPHTNEVYQYYELIEILET